jgi:hypothetical protein
MTTTRGIELPRRGIHVTAVMEQSPGEAKPVTPEVWTSITDDQLQDVMGIAADSRPGGRQAMIVTTWERRRAVLHWRVSRTAVERIRRRLSR